MDDLADDGGQAFEGGAELAGAARADLGGKCFSRRWNVVSIGGSGFFCLVLQECHEQLVVAHLLAPDTVKALEQGGDEAFLQLKLGLEGGDLGGEDGDLLCGRFDVGTLSSERAMDG